MSLDPRLRQFVDGFADGALDGGQLAELKRRFPSGLAVVFPSLRR